MSSFVKVFVESDAIYICFGFPSDHRELPPSVSSTGTVEREWSELIKSTVSRGSGVSAEGLSGLSERFGYRSGFIT
jgi:hypothetical protein